MTYKKIYWTDHVKLKMRQYGLSKGKLLNLLAKPERKEQGIAPQTVAVMTANKSYSKVKKPSGEIWLMYADTDNLRKIISAWRYPGISKPGEPIPIPESILKELENINGEYE
ncbi:hypothetical protein KW786_01860 [Candidatus Parcubacteria bacterium]|nr:hypothetical protein [Candidatus Parcubacteria bacterium]